MAIDVRDVAVRIVDARHGYTYEFSSSPDAHRAEYDAKEAELAALVGCQEDDRERRIAAHLRDHLYDGRWHDDCLYCRHRRVHGGTGVMERERDPYLSLIAKQIAGGNSVSSDYGASAPKERNE